MLNIVIRADASTWLGVGHVSRCLALAHKLKHQHTVTFVTEAGLAEQLIGGQGISYMTLPQKNIVETVVNTEHYIACLKQQMTEDAEQTVNVLQKLSEVDWVIVDHYALDEKWHKCIRPYTKRIMVIDDLANRQYDCDILLDQNYFDDLQTRYNGRVPDDCKLLLGPDCMLFRDEFIEGRTTEKRVRDELRNVLVFYGGSDATGETIKVLEAIELLNLSHIHFDIVTGKLNQQNDKIKAMCDKHSFITYHEQINYMAQLMRQADLAIGAGGATTWERAILGLPAVVTILADNQKTGIEQLEKFGFLENIGWHEDVTSEQLASIIDQYSSSTKLAEMSQAAYQFFNPNAQFTNRVVEALEWK